MASQPSSASADTNNNNHHHKPNYSTHNVTVYIIRHGERQDEADRKRKKQKVSPPKTYKEALDPPLTKEGHKQAMEAFQSISSAYENQHCEKIVEASGGGVKQGKKPYYKAFLFSSPLSRTIGTAMMSSFASSSVLDFSLPVTTNDKCSYSNEEIMENEMSVDKNHKPNDINAVEKDDNIKATSNIIVMNGLCDCAAAVHKIGGAAKAVSLSLIDCAATYVGNELEESRNMLPCLAKIDLTCSKGIKKWNREESEKKERKDEKSVETSKVKTMASKLMSNRRFQLTKSTSSTSSIKTPSTLEVKKRPIRFWKEMKNATKTFIHGDDVDTDTFRPMTKTLHLGEIEQQDSLRMSNEDYGDIDIMDSSTISSCSTLRKVPKPQHLRHDVTLALSRDADNMKSGVETVAHTIYSSDYTSTEDDSTISRSTVQMRSIQIDQKNTFIPDEEHETFMGAINRAAYLTALAGGDICVIVSHREGIRYLAEKYCGYKDRYNHHYDHQQRTHRLSTPYCCIGSFEATVKIPQRRRNLSNPMKQLYSVKWTFHGVAPYGQFQVMKPSAQSMSRSISNPKTEILPSLSSISSLQSNDVSSPFIQLVLNIPGEKRHVLSILDCRPEDNASSNIGKNVAQLAKKIPQQIEITWYQFSHDHNDNGDDNAPPTSAFGAFSRKSSKRSLSERENGMIQLRILDGRRNLAGFFQWLYTQRRLAHGTVSFQADEDGKSQKKSLVVVLNPSYQPILPCPPSMLCLNIQTT
mmetsp:Transcript_14778/g.19640  ORF Transcript_14778/g.19640 Transcript_14778/m.19640 type:complete len:751 (+) Transcript_14778:17-2269(+)